MSEKSRMKGINFSDGLVTGVTEGLSEPHSVPLWCGMVECGMVRYSLVCFAALVPNLGPRDSCVCWFLSQPFSRSINMLHMC